MARTYIKYVTADGSIKFYVNDVLTLEVKDTGDIVVTNDISAETATVTEALYDYATINSVSTVDTTTPSCNFASNDYFELAMPGDNKVMTFVNPRRGNFTLKVQHNASAYTLTFPTAYWVGETGTSAKVYTLSAGATKYTIFSIFCDGTSYFMSDISFAA